MSNNIANTIVKWTEYCIHNLTNFKGRASRTEYWSFIVVIILAQIVLGWLPLGFISLILILPLIFFVPLSVAVRRLHDINRSGWWLLLSLIPILGWLALIIMSLMASNPGENDYGTTKQLNSEV